MRYILLFIPLFFLVNCKRLEKPCVLSNKEKDQIEKLLHNAFASDSLLHYIKRYEEQSHLYGQAVGYRLLGRQYRESSQFREAIEVHRKGLDCAVAICDTNEIIQACNNLGADFRRIGNLNDASDHHYLALRYCEEYSDSLSSTSLKNEVVSLNGIGNVYLSIGNHLIAERAFRRALEGERKLGSHVGQAINYANLGIIYEAKGEIDSAYIYYGSSMAHNKEAQSILGVALCHNHFGRLAELQGDIPLAIEEYRRSYDLLEEIRDRWHWLTPCLALARINLDINNVASAAEYLDRAIQVAKEIHSPQHLADAYTLRAKQDEMQGDISGAFYNFKQSIAYSDSVRNEKTQNYLQNMRLSYEREKAQRELKSVKTVYERSERRNTYILLASLTVLLIAVIAIVTLLYVQQMRKKTTRELRKLDTIRNDFYTNITHEFRTPLTVIQGLNRQMLTSPDLTPKERIAFMNAIGRQSNALLTLVNRLMDISKIQKGGTLDSWKRGDISAYLRMTVEAYRLYAGEKGVTLTYRSQEPSIQMDFVPFYMDKILGNLLSNAIKHTPPEGRIDIEIRTKEVPDMITIRIIDTGIGIPEADLDRIFEPFYRSANSHGSVGTGIGLSFTQILVSQMNGTIEVQSTVGVGTTFTLIFPLTNSKLDEVVLLDDTDLNAITSASEEMSDSSVGDDGESEPALPITLELPILLIVEDNNDVLMYIKTLFMGKYNVITAQDGEQGLQKALQYIPDLVITDIMMPIKDGLEMVQEMRKHLAINHIPVIMLTAKASDEDYLEGLKCGVEAYIRKPFDSEELLIRTEKILESRRLLRDKYMSAVAQSDKPQAIDNDGNIKFLQTVSDLIHSEMNNPELSAAFLAERMSMSISQLSRKLNTITGYSTISYILQVKLTKAKRELRKSEKSIAEISDACGFSDANYFSRVFKKEVGMTPSQYQKINL